MPYDAAPRAGDREGMNEVGDALSRLKVLKKRFMQDPEVREEYARTDDQYGDAGRRSDEAGEISED